MKPTSSTPKRDASHLAYPEPPASPLWHRTGPRPRPLTAEQRRHNREALLRAQRRTPRPATPMEAQ
ncbi:hypothetical protein [Streptomyces sp. DSM 41033]|uniref:hypothetical protein n=1 Tax=Streptomyces sp. DSM 41033 TaxID=3448655 RepID=UPI00403FEBE8